MGIKDAQLYGADDRILGGLNSFYLLLDEPEVYGLPSKPKLPSRAVMTTNIFSAGMAAVMGVLGMITFRKRRMDQFAEERTRQEEVH